MAHVPKEKVERKFKLKQNLRDQLADERSINDVERFATLLIFPKSVYTAEGDLKKEDGTPTGDLQIEWKKVPAISTALKEGGRFEDYVSQINAEMDTVLSSLIRFARSPENRELAKDVASAEKFAKKLINALRKEGHRYFAGVLEANLRDGQAGLGLLEELRKFSKSPRAEAPVRGSKVKLGGGAAAAGAFSPGEVEAKLRAEGKWKGGDKEKKRTGLEGVDIDVAERTRRLAGLLRPGAGGAAAGGPSSSASGSAAARRPSQDVSGGGANVPDAPPVGGGAAAAARRPSQDRPSHGAHAPGAHPGGGGGAAAGGSVPSSAPGAGGARRPSHPDASRPHVGGGAAAGGAYPGARRPSQPHVGGGAGSRRPSVSSVHGGGEGKESEDDRAIAYVGRLSDLRRLEGKEFRQTEASGEYDKFINAKEEGRKKMESEVKDALSRAGAASPGHGRDRKSSAEDMSAHYVALREATGVQVLKDKLR